MRILAIYTNKRNAAGTDGKGKKKYFMYVNIPICSIIEIDKKAYTSLRFNAEREGFKIEKCVYGNERLTDPEARKDMELLNEQRKRNQLDK